MHARTFQTFQSLPRSLAIRPSGCLLRHIRCVTQPGPTLTPQRPCIIACLQQHSRHYTKHLRRRCSCFVVRRFGPWWRV